MLEFVRPKVGQLGRKSMELLTRSCFKGVYEGEYVREYTILPHILKPIASELDLFQGEKNCFLGIGMVLPLLTRIKKKLQDRVFPNLGPIRDRVIERIDAR